MFCKIYILFGIATVTFGAHMKINNLDKFETLQNLQSSNFQSNNVSGRNYGSLSPLIKEICQTRSKEAGTRIDYKPALCLLSLGSNKINLYQPTSLPARSSTDNSMKPTENMMNTIGDCECKPKCTINKVSKVSSCQICSIQCPGITKFGAIKEGDCKCDAEEVADGGPKCDCTVLCAPGESRPLCIYYVNIPAEVKHIDRPAKCLCKPADITTAKEPKFDCKCTL